MSFSNNLQKLQKKNRVTNYRLAKEVVVHATTVKNWIDGKIPRFDHVSKVAKYFDTTIEDLMK